MSETEVDFARLFKVVNRTVTCEQPGHADETLGCLLRYTEATWLLRHKTHDDWIGLVCLGYAARFRSLMSNTMTCPLCGATGALSTLFELSPLNLPSIIDER